MIEELESHFRVCSGHVKALYFKHEGELNTLFGHYMFEASELVAFECDVCGRIPEEE